MFVKTTQKKLNFRNQLTVKCKDVKPDFEQNYYSKTAKDIYRSGYDGTRLFESMA